MVFCGCGCLAGSNWYKVREKQQTRAASRAHPIGPLGLPLHHQLSAGRASLPIASTHIHSSALLHATLYTLTPCRCHKPFPHTTPASKISHLNH